jgi:hypothetical protein
MTIRQKLQIYTQDFDRIDRKHGITRRFWAAARPVGVPATVYKESIMTNTIKRNSWSRFCRTFSTSNQFCDAEVRLMGLTAEPGEATRRFSFMGMALKKEGRLIDGVQLFSATADAQPVAAPVVTITNPKEILVERDQDGADCRLTIRSVPILTADKNWSKEPPTHYTKAVVTLTETTNRTGWKRNDGSIRQRLFSCRRSPIYSTSA